MNIKKHTNYRADLFTGLLGLQILSACVNTRQGLGMDGRRQSEDHNIEECQAGCSTTNDGVPSVSDPMRLNDQHIAYLAANCFSLKSMDALLAKGLDINARNATKQTLLMCMICGSLPKVRETAFRSIIERGADINAQDENGFTALMIVIFLGDKPLITELLNLNNIDPSLETKLIMPAGKSGRRKRLSLETIIECMQVFVYHFMSLSGKPKLVAKDFTVSDSLYENQESKEIKESFIKDLVARLDEIIDRLKQG